MEYKIRPRTDAEITVTLDEYEIHVIIEALKEHESETADCLLDTFNEIKREIRNG